VTARWAWALAHWAIWMAAAGLAHLEGLPWPHVAAWALLLLCQEWNTRLVWEHEVMQVLARVRHLVEQARAPPHT